MCHHGIDDFGRVTFSSIRGDVMVNDFHNVPRRRPCSARSRARDISLYSSGFIHHREFTLHASFHHLSLSRLLFKPTLVERLAILRLVVTLATVPVLRYFL